MRNLSLSLIAILLSLSFADIANAQAVQIFGGYSYLHPTVDVSPTLNTNPNLNGWELSGTYNAWKWLGATADFSGDYGTVGGLSIHEQNYLFGPQVHLPGPVSPFAHVLIGGASETIGSLSADSVAVAAGVGIDIHVAPFLSVRPIQFDYLVTRFRSATQNQPRVSAGVVIDF